MNKNQQSEEQIYQQDQYMKVFEHFDNDQLDYILYQLLKYPKHGIGYHQVEGEIIEWVNLLELHREWHETRCTPVPKDKTKRIIWEDTLNEASTAFREEIDDWMEKHFKKDGFSLYHILDKNFHKIQTKESIDILFFFIRRIAKKLNQDLFNHELIKKFSNKIGEIL